MSVSQFGGGGGGTASSVTGPPVTPVNGIAASSDGSTSIAQKSSGSTGLPQGNASRSIECWFKTATVASAPRLVSYGDASGVNKGFEIALTGATTLALLNFNATVATWTVPTVTDNAWHHVVVTWDGTTATAYFDGVSKGTATPAAFATTLVILVLGDDNGGGATLTGSLDEVAIYSTVLSAARVSAHFAQASTGSYYATVQTDTPLRYYRFSETTGTVCNDSGSQGVALTYQSGASLNQVGAVKDPSSTSEQIYQAFPGGTPMWAAGFGGTTTNDNATAGQVGELITSQLASGSATSLSSTTTKTITSMSLTAGDWDVNGVVDFVLSGATTTNFKLGASSTNNTLGAQDTFVSDPSTFTVLSDTFAENIPVQRFSLAATTTVYLVAQATFSAGTVTAYGTIRARRVR